MGFAETLIFIRWFTHPDLFYKDKNQRGEPHEKE